MFSERWICFCCPQTYKIQRSIAPLEQPQSRPPSKTRGKKKSDITLAAVIIIQSWFRRRQALFEIRRKAAWTIYQNIEYAGEQDQLKLYNFFLDLMQAVSKNPRDALVIAKVLRRTSSLSSTAEELDLLQTTAPETVNIESSYKGQHIQLPITKGHLESLVGAFQRGETLHARYVLLILHEVRRILKRLPNVNVVSTYQSTCVTVVGDLHGNLSDLLLIFHKNGLPSNENPYIFNGDIVDRGTQSMEIFILISVAFIIYPNNVYFNRGNHEDHVLNLSWLPIASLIDDRIFVTHGGISDITDLNKINRIQRNKYVSILSPTFVIPENEEQCQINDLTNEQLLEWRQMLDLLWSDPKQGNGCEPNTYRGGGCYWGPDVTNQILEKHNWTLLIRSHECKEEGFDYCHNKKVLTIFSASNYYAAGSNRGAYVKISTNQPPSIVQFMGTKHTVKPLTIWERVSYVEEQALRNLLEKFSANKSRLMKEFRLKDPHQAGCIALNEWCEIVTQVLELQLPWRTLKSRLVDIDSNGLILYESTFRSQELQCVLNSPVLNRRQSFCQAIYRNKDLLEAVFRAMDKDNSGVISLQEFTDVCVFLGNHNGTKFDEKQIIDLATSIDLDKNGVIDFNEFLEAFRIVDIGDYNHDHS
ncbi:unnamed protein product [Rotaria sordida]|uniref:Serine/threonine-protein phosphatase with EF-hands n=1 Tax=Rotaria sordida TaxID=392033 RepID=A0A814R486_9BILA|nr:unnamed protein product [Rotaria sordida]